VGRTRYAGVANAFRANRPALICSTDVRTSRVAKDIALKYLYAIIAASIFSSVHAAELKIGVVDAHRLTRESAPAQQASKQLEQEFAPRLQAIQTRQQRVVELQRQAEKDGPVMSATDRRNAEQELTRVSMDVERLQREYEEDLNTRRNQELAALFERAHRVVQRIAESENYDLVLQDAVYRTPATDMTDRVLEALAKEK
jgi:outer membrane protein